MAPVTPATLAADAARRASARRAAAEKEAGLGSRLWLAELAAREGNPSLAAKIRGNAENWALRE